MKEEKNTNEQTKSQAKREARKKEAERAKKQAKREAFIGNMFIAVFVLAIVAIIAAFVVKAMNKVTPSDDYSACLDANGYINGASAGDIDVIDYKNLVVPLSEVEFTDEQVDERINSIVESNKVLNSDESLVVADGDEVNIDYVGKIDGVEFDGGSAEGYDLTIGSGSFIDGFEEQLIGEKIGTTVDINVTFPEDYSEDLAGKDAVFTVTLNGIEQTPEFTDEFVAENLSEYASTAEEYRQYLKDTNYDSNLKTYIQNNLETNSSVIRYNKKYLKNLKSTIKYDDQLSYENTNAMYQSYLGYSLYESFDDYTGMSETEYDKTLVDKAKDAYKNNLVYQAILEMEGASADADYYKSVLVAQGNDESYYDTLVEQYGEPYVLQMAIKEKAVELVKNMVTVQ